MKIAVLVSNFCLLFYAFMPALVSPNENEWIALLFVLVVVALNVSAAFKENVSKRFWNSPIIIGAIVCDLYLLKVALYVQIHNTTGSVLHRLIHAVVFTLPVILEVVCIWRNYKIKDDLEQ